MVEHCNHTIEDVVKKSMIDQMDWVRLLPSILFAIRTSKHSSMGYSPYRMLYNKDPIMPFQYADQLKNAAYSDDEDNSDEYDSDATEIYAAAPSDDGLMSTIQNLENQHKQIFDKAHKSIKKAQIHQVKGYNNRQAKGAPFEIGMHVLKKIGTVGVQGPQIAQAFQWALHSGGEKSLWVFFERSL